MNILFLSAVLPYPLHSGGQTRIYNLLRQLSRKHRITLVSFIRDIGEKEYLHELGFCESVHVVCRGRAWQAKYIARAITGRYPFLLSTYDNQRMKELLSKLMKQHTYDRIHIEPFYVWPSLPVCDIPVIVSEHNVEYDVYARYAQSCLIWIRPFLFWDVQKLMRWEQYVWRESAQVIAVSSNDAGVIGNYLSRPVQVVENGVDTDIFSFRQPKNGEQKRALFTGNFRWVPNVRAANVLLNEIWPKVRHRFSDATLTIAGRHIPYAIRSHAERMGVRILSDTENIVSVYHDADVLLAPITIAGGSKYKILEAMACGVVVVTTPSGISGLNAEADTHYCQADSPEEFVRRLMHVWGTRGEMQRIAKNARIRVQQVYGWDTIAHKLDAVWRKHV